MAFFAMLYLLGWLVEWLTMGHWKGAKLYPNLGFELLIDAYITCALMLIVPGKWRRWARISVAVMLYLLAFIDVFCFNKYGSTLTPTMLLLLFETNIREASEFLGQLFSTDMLVNPASWVALLGLTHALFSRKGRALLARFDAFLQPAKPLLGLAIIALLGWSVAESVPNKAAIHKMMGARSVGEVEHLLTDKAHAVFYSTPLRLAFSLYANHLAARQITKLRANAGKVRVDSCAYTVPTIVLIIGESYGKQHSSLYGYALNNTAPRQLKRAQSGLLVKYDDVVSPWNLTSFVFKNTFSLHVIGQPGTWSDSPLFPEVFRKAGYHVAFLTNQFLPKAREAVYDFSGGFFLNDPELSPQMFDVRNSSLHKYDDGLLADYDKLAAQGEFSKAKGNLIIFHLMGQHVSYKLRYPRHRAAFKAEDYAESRPELSPRQRQMVAQYDNACLYNDSIVDQICERFADKEAIIVYMPDHGEECYEGTRGIVCRNHAAKVDYDLARFEFEIPFWIYTTKACAEAHPALFEQIVRAHGRKFMTDALPHMLLYLAGISAPYYRPEYNLLGDEYRENRPRILKNSVDYDKLKPTAH